jgi:D-amino-acid oxidase
MRCTVVGAGVIGLSCAWRLVEAGHDVRLVADLEPQDTTSAVAAAIWYPYLAEPRERVGGWGATTYRLFDDLARGNPDSGVRMLPGVELFGSTRPDPWWSAAVPDLRRLDPHERPVGMVDGWTFTAPVVDMPVYLAWLRARLASNGVGLTLRRVTDVDLELATCDVVINCTGLGAQRLVGDTHLEPVRGQVVVLTNPGLTSWWLHDTDAGELTYVVPRLETVVVGGTAHRGAEELTPDPDTASAMLARATALVPELADSEVVAHRVGLRPARSAVRLEREERSGGVVVHCYGHGGAGVTLSWGCAAEVVDLVAG